MIKCEPSADLFYLDKFFHITIPFQDILL